MMETPRLQLRPVIDSDFPDVFRIQSDAEIMKHIRAAETDPEAVRGRMLSWMEYNRKNPGLGVFAVLWKETGDFVGYGVGRHVDYDPATGEYEVGYVVVPEYAGKGVAQEITRTLCRHLSEQFSPPYVVAFTAPENTASQNVLLKSGFADCGIRDIYGGSSEFRLYFR